MVDGEEILITINGQTASKRTRTNVRKSGPRFVFRKEQDSKVLVSSVGRGFNGWLPIREIKIHRLKTEGKADE